jgi:transcriptional regulator of NAD metabolism
MFVKLTNLKGLRVYINMNHVDNFMVDIENGGSYLETVDGDHYHIVRETPEEIMKLMEKK